MTKFELTENTIQVLKKNYTEYTQGITLTGTSQYPEVLKSFDSEDEALEALKNYKTRVDFVESSLYDVVDITEYYVTEMEYDEDDEFVSGGDVLRFAEVKDDN